MALGIIGWSGAGKTTLLTGVLPLLVARGLRVSTIKHTHHAFDLDQPGKDSHRHREAGAHEVLLVGGARWALLHEGEPPPLAGLLGRLQPADLVLVEGLRAGALPKIEVYRPALGRPPQWPGRADIVAVATDAPLQAVGPALLHLSDTEAVAAWIAAWLTTWDRPPSMLQDAPPAPP